MWGQTITLSGASNLGRREVRRRVQYKWRVDSKLDWKEYQEAVEEVFIGWEEEEKELEQELGGRIIEVVWNRWKEKVIAAAEKGIGRKKVAERSEGWWSEDVERLIVIRKMTCRKLSEGSKEEKSGHGYTEPTMGRLQKSERGSKKGYHEREEGIEEENSEED